MWKREERKEGIVDSRTLIHIHIPILIPIHIPTISHTLASLTAQIILHYK